MEPDPANEGWHYIYLPAGMESVIINANDGAGPIRQAVSITLLRMKPRPQAVICANNPIALGFMQALQAKGIRVPEDLALITFDSYPFSLFTDPPMTVVDINMYEMGQEAGRLVLQKLRHPATQIQTYITTPTLVYRGTTAPHAAG